MRISIGKIVNTGAMSFDAQAVVKRQQKAESDNCKTCEEVKDYERQWYAKYRK